MVDPYEFIARESVVSSSQEDILKHIPGWEEKQEHEALLSPSQAPLSRLHGCGSDSSDEESEPAPTSAFCMQEPLEWASPDTQACQNNDSYNPAFESDRSRSLSPNPHYGDMWGSRLITQSQNGADMYIGFSHLIPLGGPHDFLLVDEAVKKRTEEMMLTGVNEHCSVKDVPAIQAGKAGFKLGSMSRREQREVHLQSTSKDYGQAPNYKPVELGRRLKQSGVNPSIGILNVGQPDLYSIGDHKKDSFSTEMLDGNGNLQNNSMTQAAGKFASIFDRIPNSESANVAVNEQDEQQAKPGISANGQLEASSAEQAMVRPRINSSTAGVALVKNDRKRKDEGGCAFAKSSQKLNSSKEPTCEQQHSILASETNQFRMKEVKGSRSKNHLGGECVAESSDTACFLAFMSGNISACEMQKARKAEIVKDLVDDTIDCTLLPESVMDVVMLVSEVLPTPGPDDPDLLSIVMNTGVSLPLPFRDCIGRFICNKSTRS